jgi:branched-chain amino acid transport system permease protein
VVLIGGVFSLFGAVIGGLLSQAFPSLLSQHDVDGNLIFVIFGLGLIHAISTAPRGIAGQIEGLVGVLRRRSRDEDDA